MKKVLITGASGFIGRNLKEALADRYELFTPTHKELELTDFDALERYVREYHIEIIIHAAVHVPMINGVENEYFNDMKMFLNLEKISHSIEKLLYFGSGAEFDKRYNIRMVREEDFGRSIPTSEYGLAKYTMNVIARKSDNIYNLRLFGIFGKYELWSIKFLSNLCCKAVFNLPLTIRKDCYFDFLYIEDLPAIVEWFIENKPREHDYNVCMGKEYLLTELAEIVRLVSNKNLPLTVLNLERNLDYSASNERLTCEMHSFNLTSIEVALRKLYEYYYEHKDLIDLAVLSASK